MHITHRLISFALLSTLLVPAFAVSAPTNEAKPRTQDFVVTAYYSPLPNQCCYVTGSYETDIALNGNGTNGADGTEVHLGMAAGPASYPFGTRISVPGIGVVTVQDRGSAIKTGSGADRLDIWMGAGEEGLARALAYGQRHVTGTVYPVGGTQPPEKVDLSAVAPQFGFLQSYAVAQTDLLSIRPKNGDHGYSVQMLQDTLREIGYFTRSLSGNFGDQTTQALSNFLRDYGVSEPADHVTDTTAAYLLAVKNRVGSIPPVTELVAQGANPSAVRSGQRTLRFLGYYRGRTDGQYGPALHDAIVSFQIASKVLRSGGDSGAGILGPRTRLALGLKWNAKLVAEQAQSYLVIARIRSLLVSKGYALGTFLSKGDSGSQVRVLQALLAERGFLEKSQITGFFGSETEDAVVAYQLHAGLIKGKGETGAGRVGPGTRKSLTAEEGTKLYELVRSQGWKSVL